MLISQIRRKGMKKWVIAGILVIIFALASINFAFAQDGRANQQGTDYKGSTTTRDGSQAKKQESNR